MVTDDKPPPPQHQENDESTIPTILQNLALLPPAFSSSTDIHISKVSGGTTNRIYKCDFKTPSLPSLLLRFFGQGTEVLIDREREAQCFHAVAAKGLGPKLLASFPQGRVEQFLPAQPLTAEQYRSPAISRMLARRLAALHSIENIHIDTDTDTSTPLLFPRLRAWAAMALEKCVALGAGGTNKYEGFDMLELVKEVDRLEKRLQDNGTLASSHICLCHNDAQHLNVLMLQQQRTRQEDAHPASASGSSVINGNEKDKPCLMFVDLEYAGPNYRGFDLGNMLCEFASDFQSCHPHVLNFARFYPTVEAQRGIARAYLGKEEEEEEDKEKGKREEKKEEKDEEVEALVHEMQEFALASHLLWGVWGLLQSKMSTIDFDFVAYAKQRLAEYCKGMDLVDGKIK